MKKNDRRPDFDRIIEDSGNLEDDEDRELFHTAIAELRDGKLAESVLRDEVKRSPRWRKMTFWLLGRSGDSYFFHSFYDADAPDRDDTLAAFETASALVASGKVPESLDRLGEIAESPVRTVALMIVSRGPAGRINALFGAHPDLGFAEALGMLKANIEAKLEVIRTDQAVEEAGGIPGMPRDDLKN